MEIALLEHLPDCLLPTIFQYYSPYSQLYEKWGLTHVYDILHIRIITFITTAFPFFNNSTTLVVYCRVLLSWWGYLVVSTPRINCLSGTSPQYGNDVIDLVSKIQTWFGSGFDTTDGIIRQFVVSLNIGVHKNWDFQMICLHWGLRIHIKNRRKIDLYGISNHNLSSIKLVYPNIPLISFNGMGKSVCACIGGDLLSDINGIVFENRPACIPRVLWYKLGKMI